MIKGTRRSAAQLARDRRRIADLYLQGWIQADIADELDLNQSTISRDLKGLHQKWLESALLDIDAKKSRELAKVDRLEREYWDAWQRSKEDAETVTVKGKGKSTAEDPEQREKTVQKRGQVGDPSFLRGVQWCIEQRCKILGIESPSRYELTGKDSEPLSVVLNWGETYGDDGANAPKST